MNKNAIFESPYIGKLIPNKKGYGMTHKYIKRTYRLTKEVVIELESITDRVGKEAGIELPLSKVLELIILYTKNKSFQELTKSIK
jgi:hypothetical protein